MMPVLVFPLVALEVFSRALEAAYGPFPQITVEMPPPLSTPAPCPPKVDTLPHPSYASMTPEWRAAEEASYQEHQAAWARGWSIVCGKCDRKISECECG